MPPVQHGARPEIRHRIPWSFQPRFIQMRRCVSFSLLLYRSFVSSVASSAQLLAAKYCPIVYGHHQLNATNPGEAKKLWVDTLGGTLVKFGTNNVEVIKIPNALIFMRSQKPTGGT